MSETVTESGTLRAGIAEEVRALLGRRRMSDIALARRIQRSHTYVYRRLSAETAFDADDLEKIAIALGVEVVDLLPRSRRRSADTETTHTPLRRTVTKASRSLRPRGPISRGPVGQPGGHTRPDRSRRTAPIG